VRTEKGREDTAPIRLGLARLTGTSPGHRIDADRNPEKPEPSRVKICFVWLVEDNGQFILNEFTVRHQTSLIPRLNLIELPMTSSARG
jgi:hypothetical protein